MYKYISTLMLFIFSTFLVKAHEENILNQKDINPNITPYNDAADALKGLSTKHLYKQQAWINFQQHYPNWGARFNYYSKLPHRAFGEPIVFNGGGTNPIEKAKAFIASEFAGFNIPLQNLVVTRNNNDGKYINVDFKQQYQGLDILFSRVSVRFTQDLKIVMIGLDAHTQISENMPVNITAVEAMNFAAQQLVTPILESKVSIDMKIIALPENGKYNYKKVYEVNIKTQDTEEMQGDYTCYVSAEDGKILYRFNKVKRISYDINASVHLTGPYVAPILLPLRNLKVVDNATTFYTNANGTVVTSGATANSTISLEGRWVKVVTTQNGTTAATTNANISVANSTFTYPVTAPNATVAHFTCYYHVDVVHDFMKTKLPAAFTDMDNALLARVDRTDGNCNAFYNGTSINFYTASNGCNQFSLIGDVMYHEYGHGITNVFWQSQGQNFDNGAMGEGYSDAWAFSINDNPIIGLGYSSTNQNAVIRRYDLAPKVYPQDIQGEVHADGEIIAGAWWDTRLNMGSSSMMSTLFGLSHSGLANGPDGAEGQVYYDILIDALQYDDTDANLNNGTPNFNAIVTAFAKHGIYLLSNTELDHSEPGVVNSAITVPIEVEATVDFPAFLGAIKMFYREKGTSTLDSLVLNQVGSTNIYNANFPNTTAGKVYEYYFAAYDNLNTYSVINPVFSKFVGATNKRNLPHYLFVGYTSKWQELFSDPNTLTGWQVGNYTGDLAPRGLWIIDVPVPSYQNISDTTTIVQTKYDVDGGGKCAITANANSSTTSVGSQDVDGGRTTLVSDAINIAGYQRPFLSYYRWFTNSQGSNAEKDLWQVDVSYDNGASWISVEKTYKPDVSWRRATIELFPGAGNSVKVKFVAIDSAIGGGGGALVEAAVDNLQILDIGETPASVKNVIDYKPMVYPNPVNDLLQIIAPQSGKIAYELIDAVGKTVYKNENNAIKNIPISINTKSFSSGTYFIKINQNGKSYSQKITIKHN
jgi:hypothetical protein